MPTLLTDTLQLIYYLGQLRVDGILILKQIFKKVGFKDNGVAARKIRISTCACSAIK
jgi:hypothetical protein